MTQASPPLAESLVARLLAGEDVEVPASGGSMFPLVRNADMVRIRPIAAAPRVGDVVLAVIAGRWVLHRVVAVHADRYTLRGDNRRVADPPVSRAAIVGLALSSRRGARRVPLAWPTPLARAWMVASRAVAAVTPIAEVLRRPTRSHRPRRPAA